MKINMNNRLHEIINKISEAKVMGEFDLSLIREFRTRPGFYDRNSPLFKDKVYNAREWQQIANKLGYDVSLLKDRMLQLRNRYNLEKRRLEQYHEENPGKHVDSPWPLYDELTFLSEHIRARRSYKRLLPVNASLSLSYDQKQSSYDMAATAYGNLNDQQQLYSQQYYNDRGSSNLIANGGADTNSDAASFAANGLLAVKMEEMDDDDTEMQAQDVSEDNFDHSNFNGTHHQNYNETTDADIHAKILQPPLDRIYRQQQQQSQQQQQRDQHLLVPRQQRGDIDVNTKDRKQKHSYHQQQQQQQQHNNNGYKKLHLTRVKHQINQKQKQHNLHKERLRQHHQQQQQQQQQHQQRQGKPQNYRQHSPRTNSSYFGGYNYTAPPNLNQQQSSLFTPTTPSHHRMQKYLAFGSFMSSSLSELSKQKALTLVEKFTSEVVKVMLIKHTETTAGGISSTSTSGAKKNNTNNLNNDKSQHNNNNHNSNNIDIDDRPKNLDAMDDDITGKNFNEILSGNGNGNGSGESGMIENIALSSSSSSSASSVVDANSVE